MTELMACAAPQNMLEDVPKPRVLVVDDERVVADTLVLILNKNGFEARGVYSGEAALALAREFLPRTIVSDVIMGGMNGVEMAIRLRGLLPEARLLLFCDPALTAGLLEKAQAQGHQFETLTKPVGPAELMKKLREGVPSLRANPPLKIAPLKGQGFSCADETVQAVSALAADGMQAIENTVPQKLKPDNYLPAMRHD